MVFYLVYIFHNFNPKLYFDKFTNILLLNVTKIKYLMFFQGFSYAGNKMDGWIDADDTKFILPDFESINKKPH